MTEINIDLMDGTTNNRWQPKPLPKVYVTHEQLQKIAPIRQTAIDLFLPYLNAGFEKYGITTPKRISAFLAQIIHESGNFRYTKEIWGPTTQQKKYERDFSHPYKAGLKSSDRNYLSFMLGNDEVGCGKFFMGRALIQITGKTNYFLCSKALFGDNRLLKTPQLLEVPEYAVAAAFWYCVDFKHLLDEFDTEGINDETRKVNGGLNGIEDRTRIYNRAMMVLAA